MGDRMEYKEAMGVISGLIGKHGIRSAGFNKGSGVIIVYYYGEKCDELEAIVRRRAHPVQIEFHVFGELPVHEFLGKEE